MRKVAFFLLSCLLLVSCAEKAQIIVYNDTNIDRQNELVEFCLCSIKDKLSILEGDKIIILDAKNRQIPYQLLSDKETVVFPASVNANDSSLYTIIIGDPDTIKAKTFCRKVPERMDDFTWENDRIAFRMYGPALANQNPSNGVDVWLKRTENLIIDKFYKNDLAKIQSYHVDNGEGLDCYKVGHTLGAGGIAPYIDTTLFIGSHYNKFEVVENGPLRSVFRLTYDTLRIGTNTVKGTLYITIDAGSQLNEARVIYEGSNNLIKQVAAGISMHDSIVVASYTNRDKGLMAYAENAISDAGIPSGRSYVGVIMLSPVDSIITKEKHLLSIVKYSSRKPLVYYFGAGWSKWGFPKDKDWFDYMEKSVVKIRKPLKLIFK